MSVTLLLAPLLSLAPSAAHHGIEVIEHLTVLERTAPGRRSPIVVDAVEAQLARGTFEAPEAGATVELPDGRTLTWEAIQAEDGQFRHGALRQGWGYATVERDEPEVMLLDAAGHRRAYVNGIPCAGDIYSLGNMRVPVKLEAGTNELLFRGGRGRLRATLLPPPADIYIESRDRTLPDVIRGETEALQLGIRVVNATEEWVRDLSIHADGVVLNPVGEIPPLSFRQARVSVRPPADPGEAFSVTLGLRRGDEELHRDSFELRVREPGQAYRRTFVSEIDGSVQYYAVTPPSQPVENPALFLSLHGASVEAINQASSYRSKDWGIVVAPTNRRPFGFDWEDWGRLDALEVLADAKERFGTDPTRQYLTGHSMGGHGTWQLGVHFPGSFAVVAPSAGWRDFWSYGTGAVEEPDPVERLLDESVNASRTLLLEENLLHAGVYVLHGDADDNVPVTQARFMRERLAAFHPNFAYYERKGAGHWWTIEDGGCTDWPPLFDFFADNTLSLSTDVKHVRFTTMSPAINATCHWAAIETQLASMQPSAVDLRIEVANAEEAAAHRLSGTTQNVAQLRIDVGQSPASAGSFPFEIELDGQTLSDPASNGVIVLSREQGGEWRTGPLPDGAKSPACAGPFKDAFRNRVLFVYGTQGSAEATRLNRAKALFDAQVFAYRGNGSIDVVPDTQAEAMAEGGRRNLVLFGNADDHLLWEPLLGKSPVQVRSGSVVVGDRTIEGDDLVVLVVRPHVSAPDRLVAAVASTGPVGQRLSFALPYFVSGVGYPDWTIVGADMLTEGSAGIRAAGFFGPDWSLEQGRSAFR